MAGPKKRLGPATSGITSISGTADYADFYNAKNSKYSEGSDKTTGASSAEPNKYSKNDFGKGASPSISVSDNENSRQSRLGNSQTVSGPKRRKPDGQKSEGNHKFFNHDITNHLGKK